MIIVYYTAVRADRNVNSGFAEILISCCGNLNKRRRLPSADALLFAGYTDRTAADTDLDKVGSRFGKEAEPVAVNNVARSDLHAVAVVSADEIKRLLLPAGVTLGSVNAQHVNPRIYKRRNALGIVACVDSGSDHKAFLTVKQLLRIFLMLGIVLAEHKIAKPVLAVHYRQRVELVVPDYIVCFLERGVFGRGDELFARSHEFRYTKLRRHTRNTVIASGNDAEQMTVAASVVCYRNSAVTVAFDKRKHVSQSVLRSKVGIAYHKACLVAFYARDHGSLIGYALRPVNKRKTALACKSYCHFVVRNRLHYSGDERYVEIYRRAFAAAEFDERSSERNIFGYAVGRGVARYEQIFAEGVRGFRVEVCHFKSPYLSVLLFFHQSTAGCRVYDAAARMVFIAIRCIF